MKRMHLTLIGAMLFSACQLRAQNTTFEKYEVRAVNVQMDEVKINGRKALRVIKDSSVKAFDEPTFVKLGGVNFKDGTIEVRVLSRLLPNAPEMARGFIGVAFRINETNTKYESIYLRPLNARAQDQVRRNHSTQYYSYPEYKFDTLRKISPERYESYVDLEMNKWVTMRIEVKGTQAELFINDNDQPSLVVTDLKHGAGESGSIGFWVDIGTEGYFSDFRIRNDY